MANPQTENGYTIIANEILEALTKASLNGTEFKVILCIIRKTYGFKKKEDSISLTQFVKFTRSSLQAICKTLNKLILNKLILVNKGGYINKYRFNKRYNEWILNKRILNSCLLNKRLKTTKQMDNQILNSCLDTKETITKETITKESGKSKKQKIFSKEVQKLSDFLYELIKQNDPKFNKNARKWDDAMDKIIRIDKRDYNEVAKIIQFAQESDFWKGNILCGAKLREKYTQLLLQAKEKGGNAVFIS